MNVCMRVFSEYDRSKWTDYSPDGQVRETGVYDQVRELVILKFINTLTYQPTIVPIDDQIVVYYLVKVSPLDRFVQEGQNPNVVDDEDYR